MTEQNSIYKLPVYEELGITNDFMFGKIMQNESICRPFLEQILDMKIDRLVYLSRQETMDPKIDAHSIRLDIYAEDGSAVYDCEMQTAPQADLPKRSRYYQSQIDINLIQKGEKYQNLKKSFVIFICTFDPFGKEQYIYTFEHLCRQVPGLQLNDEALKIFIYTKGPRGSVTEDFRKLMRYFDTSVLNSENENSLTREMDKALNAARSNKEWRHDMLTLELLKQDCFENGCREERKKSRRALEKERKETVLRMQHMKMSPDVIAAAVGISEEEVRAIIAPEEDPG